VPGKLRQVLQLECFYPPGSCYQGQSASQKITYDAGNFAVAGKNPVVALETMLEHIAYIHLKDLKKMERLVVQNFSLRGVSLYSARILKLYENIPAFRDIKVEVEMTKNKVAHIIAATQG
jgi:hypothetical protein